MARAQIRTASDSQTRCLYVDHKRGCTRDWMRAVVAYGLVGARHVEHDRRRRRKAVRRYHGGSRAVPRLTVRIVKWRQENTSCGLSDVSKGVS